MYANNRFQIPYDPAFPFQFGIDYSESSGVDIFIGASIM
jgi:hypothetical protein